MLKKLLENRTGRIVFWIAVIIVIGAFLWLTAPKAVSLPTANENASAPGELPAAANVPANANANANANKPKAVIKKPAAAPIGFPEKRAPHFVSSSIAPNSTISQIPPTLTLTFDARLQKSTQTYLVSKKNDITDATTAPSSIMDKTLVVKLNTQVTDGDYYVHYVACFADVGCKDGKFGYRVKLP